MEESSSAPISIETRRSDSIQSYLAVWAHLIAEWNEPDIANRLWLMYSANYLLRTAGLHWAIDPVRLSHRLYGAPEANFRRGLESLSLVVLTHRHEDHLDLGLIHELRELPILWVVPEAILSLVLEEGGVPRTRVIVPEMLRPLDFPGLHLTPFEGLHWDQQADHLHGVPAVGYLAEFGGRRWLFPGDTRTYAASRLPDFGPIDGLIAHLWLGRGSAQLEKAPLLEPFIDFCLAFQPRRILLTHLDEFGRGPEDLWEERHARLVCEAIRQRAPGIQAAYARMGDSIELD